MNKAKLLVRIISGVLVTIMLLGLIVPYVSATEIEEVGTTEGVSTNEEVVDSTLEGAWNDGVDSIATSDDNSNIKLPAGFEYVEVDGIKRVQKSDGNTLPAIALSETPSTFDTYVVTVFIGNLQTHEIRHFDLYYFSGYVTSMSLDDGYYVIFANNCAWEDADGNTYAINGGEYKYIYIGDDYDPELYGVEFETTDEIFQISMGPAYENMDVVQYDGSLLVNDSEVAYPDDAKLEKLNEVEDIVTEPQPTTDNVSDSDVGGKDVANPDDTSVFKMLLNGIKDSWFILTLIAACYIGLQVIKFKKRLEMEKQAENDKYDDKRIN